MKDWKERKKKSSASQIVHVIQRKKQMPKRKFYIGCDHPRVRHRKKYIKCSRTRTSTWYSRL